MDGRQSHCKECTRNGWEHVTPWGDRAPTERSLAQIPWLVIWGWERHPRLIWALVLFLLHTTTNRNYFRDIIKYLKLSRASDQMVQGVRLCAGPGMKLFSGIHVFYICSPLNLGNYRVRLKKYNKKFIENYNFLKNRHLSWFLPVGAPSQCYHNQH